jgi:serine/threonine protein kinase
MNSSQPTAESAPSQALPPGTRLEEFVVERILGSGGFGITYLARDSRLGRQVVIKENLPAQFCWRDTTSLTVQPRHTSGEDADNFQYSLDSFEKEAATLASLDHPGIVKVLRSFEANGTAYFVMPFVDGTTLDEVMREREAKKKSFSEEELTSLLTKVLDALAYLHERGIYHRDIKPGNILITHTGAPVLIDFGAARQRLSERSLTVIESPGYTPFEQMQSRGKVGPWSDLYALGGTLYKAITGETPAKAADRIMVDPQVPLAERAALSGRYSVGFLAGIDRAMRPKAAERFQATEMWMRADEVRVTFESVMERVIVELRPNPTQTPELLNALVDSLRTFAAQGNTTAMVWLSLCYNNGIVMAMDEAASVDWLRKAGALDDPVALRSLMTLVSSELRWVSLRYLSVTNEETTLWSETRVSPLQSASSFEWLSKAAESGNPAAMLEMANLWRGGIDGPPDESIARAWEKLAAETHWEDGVVSWALVCLNEENESTRQTGMKLLEQAASGGSIFAKAMLGVTLFRGEVVNRDVHRALILFRQVASHTALNAPEIIGVAMSNWALGYYHTFEEPVPPSLPKPGSVEYLRKAASMNFPQAMVSLGNVLLGDYGIPQDPQSAFQWFQRASELGNIDALVELGACYESGCGTHPDAIQALRFYTLGSERGHPDGTFRLGLCYINGIGTQSDVAKGKTLIQRAAEMGSTEAAELLNQPEGFRAPEGIPAIVVVLAIVWVGIIGTWLYWFFFGPVYFSH